ncbi:O-antigen ligase family protein, partial [Campylobacter geochelonis]
TFIFLLHGSIYTYLIGLIYSYKIIYLFLLFFSIYVLLIKKYINYSFLLININICIALTSIILITSFVFNIGFPTYIDGAFGTKGFFAAGNGLGIYLGIGLLISIFYYSNTKNKYLFLVCILNICALSLIGTKTTFLFLTAGLVFLCFYFDNKLLSVILSIIIIICLFVFKDSIASLLSKMFDVVLFRFNNSGSFSHFLLSSRDSYLIEAFKHVNYDGMYIIRIFFGLGAYYSFRNFDDYTIGIDILESDVSDIFFMYGINILVIYLFIMCFIVKFFIIKKQYLLMFASIMLFGHSILAGHVLFNGMSGIMIPLIVIIGIFSNNTRKRLSL